MQLNNKKVWDKFDFVDHLNLNFKSNTISPENINLLQIYGHNECHEGPHHSANQNNLIPISITVINILIQSLVPFQFFA